MLQVRLAADVKGICDHWSLRSATDAIPLPNPKPRALCEHFVVPSIRRRDVAYAEWSTVRDFENDFYPLDFGNGLLGVHSVSMIGYKTGMGQTIDWE
jgi:hypothetical protein